MQEPIKYIELKGRRYPLVFNLNVMEIIQDEYGSFEKWGELTDGKKSEVNVKALKFGIKEMINEGIDIENENTTEKHPFLTDKQVGRLITELGMQNVTNKMQETVIVSTQIEKEEKNV